MKEKLLKGLKLILMAILSFTFMAQIFYQPDAVAEAATNKPSIAKSMTIPIGKMGSKVQWMKNSYDIVKAQKLTVKNKIKGATYTFKSSDTKVVTINKDGGYLTGIKEGSATITCTQKYKNKTTTVGTCKVTVKKAVLKVNDFEEPVFAIGTHKYGVYEYFEDYEKIYHIEYRNPQATYTLESDSKNLKIKEVKCDASSLKDLQAESALIEMIEDYIGDKYFYGYEFTAKKAGIYKVTVKETYNKKTRTLGSFKVIIKNTGLVETDIEMNVDDYEYAYYLLEYPNPEKLYYFLIEDADPVPENNAVVLYLYEDTLIIYANKPGSAKISVREDSQDGALIGIVNIDVIE